MPPPDITGLYAVPLALMMTVLAVRVIMLRAKTGISILDGGNPALALRMRRHGNFVENVPMVLLLMTIAELLGAAALWLHLAGGLLVCGRILHAFGLSIEKPAALARIAGVVGTIIAMLVLASNIVAIAFAG